MSSTLYLNERSQFTTELEDELLGELVDLAKSHAVGGNGGMTALRIAVMFASPLAPEEILPFLDLTLAAELMNRIGLESHNAVLMTETSSNKNNTTTSMRTADEEDYDEEEGSHQDVTENENESESSSLNRFFPPLQNKRTTTTPNKTYDTLLVDNDNCGNDDDDKTNELLQMVVRLYNIEFTTHENQFKSVLDAWPKAAAKRFGKHNFTSLLHVACALRVSVGIIEMLVGADPTAVILKDCNDETPLDWAVVQDAATDVLQVLMDTSTRLVEENLSKSNIDVMEEKGEEPAAVPDKKTSAVHFHPSVIMSKKKKGEKDTSSGGGGERLRRSSIFHVTSSTLSRATRNHASYESVKLLLKTDETAASIVDIDTGKTPLSFALEGYKDNDPHLFKVVELLVKAENGKSLSISDFYGRLPLHVAAVTNRSVQVVKLILEAYPQAISAVDIDGSTPIHLALQQYDKGQYEIYKLLADESSLGLQDDRNRTPFHVAAANGASSETLELLIDDSMVLKKGEEDHTPLHLVASKGDVGLVEKLLSLSKEPTTWLDSSGRTPLMVAAQNHVSVEILKLLVEANETSAAMTDSKGASALHYELENYGPYDPTLVEVIRLFHADCASCLKMGAQTGQQMLPLHVAARRGVSHEALQLLVEGNPDALVQGDVYGFTPLHYALTQKSLSIGTYQLLASNKDCLAIQDDHKKRTPFHVAFENDQPLLVLKELLTESMALIQDRAGRCALHLMAAKEGASVAECTEVFNLNPEAAKVRDIHGRFPLHHLAEHVTSDTILGMVIKANLEAVKEVDDSGRTPLHCACLQQTNLNAVRIILDVFKEATTMKDNQGKTPLHIIADHEEASDDFENLLLSPGGEWDEFLQPLANQDRLGCTPLHWAATKSTDRSALLQALIERKEETLGLINHEQKTPLHLMAEHKASIEVIKLALDAHPEATSMQDKLGRTPLHWASERSQESITEVIFEKNTKASQLRDAQGDYPLHLVSKAGLSEGMFKKVFSAHEDAGWAIGSMGRNPLHWAAMKGHSPTCVSVLINKFGHAMLTIQDETGSTPVHLAASHNVLNSLLGSLPKLMILQSLLLNSRKKTPLHCAAECKSDKETIASIFALSRQRNSDLVAQQDQDGNTPLHLAVAASKYGGDLSGVMELLKYGSDAVRIRNSEGRTPVHFGVDVGADERVLYELLQYKTTLKLYDYGRETVLLTALKAEKVYTAELMKAILDAYPTALRLESFRSPNPPRFIVVSVKGAEEMNFRYFSKLMKMYVRSVHFRDTKCLQPLCETLSARRLSFFFSLFDCRPEEEQDLYPLTATIDLNDYDAVAELSLLELIADLDTNQSPDIFFSLKEQLWQQKSTIEFQCDKGGLVAFNLPANFVLQETILQRAARRAKLSKDERLRLWGENYGRFLNKYKLNVDNDLKYVSTKTAIVFGTEATASGAEKRVMVKFFAGDEAFKSEIRSREEIIDPDEKCVFGIRAAYSIKSKDSLGFESPKIVYEERRISRHLRHYPQLRLKPRQGKNPLELLHVLVMNRNRTSDFIDPEFWAGKTERKFLESTHSIAECMRFLNEECGILHGKVRPSNFVFDRRYRVIGLEESVKLDGTQTLRERETIQEDEDLKYSGYLPPEHAAREYYFRSSGAGFEKSPLRLIEERKYKEMIDKLQQADIDGADSSSALQDFLSARQRFIKWKSANAVLPQLVATRQYDMWCFGVMLYFLATGIKLVQMDSQDEIEERELKVLIAWDQTKLDEKLNRLPKSWEKVKLLLNQLLQADPLKRPHSWTDVLKSLDGKASMRQIRELFATLEAKIDGVSEAITLQGLELKSRDEQMFTLLQGIDMKVDQIPELMVQMQNVTCPYLFRFVSKPTQTQSALPMAPTTAKDVDACIEGYLARADSFLTFCTHTMASSASLVNKITSNATGTIKAAAKTFIQNQLGIKSHTIYLELVCGWTLSPVVTYKISYTDCPTEIVKFAHLGAGLCSVALKASILWDTAAQGARMFGIPLPFVPKGQVEKGVDFFNKMNMTPEFKKFDENAKMNLEVLSAFDRFLTSLEAKNDRIRWRDKMCQAVATLEGAGKPTKQITYISKAVSKSMGGQAYYDELRVKGKLTAPSSVSTQQANAIDSDNLGSLISTSEGGRFQGSSATDNTERFETNGSSQRRVGRIVGLSIKVCLAVAATALVIIVVTWYRSAALWSARLRQVKEQYALVRNLCHDALKRAVSSLCDRLECK